MPRGLAEILAAPLHLQVAGRVEHAADAERGVDQEPAQRLHRIARPSLQQLVDEGRRRTEVVEEVGHAQPQRLGHDGHVGARQRPGHGTVDGIVERVDPTVHRLPRIVGPGAADRQVVGLRIAGNRSRCLAVQRGVVVFLRGRHGIAGRRRVGGARLRRWHRQCAARGAGRGRVHRRCGLCLHGRDVGNGRRGGQRGGRFRRAGAGGQRQQQRRSAQPEHADHGAYGPRR